MSIAAPALRRTPDARQQLRTRVSQFAFARRRAEAIRLGARGAAIGGLLAMIAGIVAQVLNLAVGEALAILLLLGPIVIASTIGWLRRTSDSRLTLEIDHQLDLGERVTTALEMASRTDQSSEVSVRRQAHRPSTRQPLFAGQSELADLQIVDAVAHLVDARPGMVYPLRQPRRLLAAVAVGIILALAPWVLPWQNLLGGELPASRVATANQAEATRLEAVAQQLQSQTAPGDQQTRAQIAAQLRQAAAALRQSGSNSQQATQALQQAQQATSAAAPQTGEDASLTLARIADALNNSALTQPATQALDQQNPAQAAATLQQLANNVGTMTPAQRQELANALQAASSAAQNSDTNASQELQQAAQAAKNGDSQGAQQAAQALQQLGAASQAQRDVAQAQSELQSSRDTISQANQTGSAASAQANAQQNSSGDPSQSSQGNGSQSAASQAQPGAAGQTASDQTGSGAQSGPSDQSGSQSGAQQGDQPGNGVGSGSANHQGAPQDAQSLAQREVTVPTDQNGDPSSISPSNQLQQGTTGGSTQVDYLNVLPQYRQQAIQDIEGNVVPSGLKQVVKGYFDSLSPSTSR